MSDKKKLIVTFFLIAIVSVFLSGCDERPIIAIVSAFNGSSLDSSNISGNGMPLHLPYWMDNQTLGNTAFFYDVGSQSIMYDDGYGGILDIYGSVVGSPFIYGSNNFVIQAGNELRLVASSGVHILTGSSLNLNSGVCIYFSDGSTQCSAATPNSFYDQSLNTSDNVRFNSTIAKDYVQIGSDPYVNITQGGFFENYTNTFGFQARNTGGFGFAFSIYNGSASTVFMSMNPTQVYSTTSSWLIQVPTGAVGNMVTNYQSSTNKDSLIIFSAATVPKYLMGDRGIDSTFCLKKAKNTLDKSNLTGSDCMVEATATSWWMEVAATFSNATQFNNSINVKDSFPLTMNGTLTDKALANGTNAYVCVNGTTGVFYAGYGGC